jgi:hypothetical protein
MIFRLLELQKMSSYVIDDIKQDLERFSQINHKSIAKVDGFANSDK